MHMRGRSSSLQLKKSSIIAQHHSRRSIAPLGKATNPLRSTHDSLTIFSTQSLRHFSKCKNPSIALLHLPAATSTHVLEWRHFNLDYQVNVVVFDWRRQSDPRSLQQRPPLLCNTQWQSNDAEHCAYITPSLWDAWQGADALWRRSEAPPRCTVCTSKYPQYTGAAPR
jgi:hypothetical protein